MIFRVSRGNAFVQFKKIEEKLYDYNGGELNLLVYFVVYPHTSEYLKSRLIKVCDSFNHNSND